MKQFFPLSIRSAAITSAFALVASLASASSLESEAKAQQASSPTTSAPTTSSTQGSSAQSGNSAGMRTLADSFRQREDSLSWRGNRFFLGDVDAANARFERYLNTPPQATEDDLTYDQLLTGISRRLLGEGGGTDARRVSEAWRMLYQAAEFPMDAGLSQTLADRVVSFWQINERVAALNLREERLLRDRQYRENVISNIEERDRREFIDLTRGLGGQNNPPPPGMDHLTEPERRRLQEIQDQIDEGTQFRQGARINQRLEFQSLIIQFFVQRRFQHALIANNFYRYMFNAEENTLEGAEALRGQIFGDLDVKLTTSTLDALAREAVEDVRMSLQTVDFLLGQGEIHTASMRLMEAFYLGEYLPSIKRYPLEKKRQVAVYLRDLNRLATALETKSFERAESLLERIEEYAHDFDGGGANAFIQTSKQLSNLAIQKALSAAHSQDRAGIEAALQEAVAFWPTNPEIQNFTSGLLERTDVRDLAAVDFDRFIRQQDYRAIFNDRFRFAAALALDGERNDAFLDIMKRMERIESAMAQASELSRIDNAFGAWEVLERVYREYPEDMELNRMRGDFAVKASVFASLIARSEAAWRERDASRALFAYLEARELYPASFFVEEGIDRAVTKIMSAKAPIVTE